MDEAKKTNHIRGEKFKRHYFCGRIIDIGCGPDLVVPHAVPFDLAQGDAQSILDYFKPDSFDCVHSSHCLEHMENVEEALCNWWQLVKPGGYLVIVVPDEDLYEQGLGHRFLIPITKQRSILKRKKAGRQCRTI